SGPDPHQRDPVTDVVLNRARCEQVLDPECPGERARTERMLTPVLLEDLSDLRLAQALRVRRRGSAGAAPQPDTRLRHDVAEPLGRSAVTRRNHDGVRLRADNFEHDVTCQAGAATTVLEHHHGAAEDPAEPGPEHRDGCPGQPSWHPARHVNRARTASPWAGRSSESASAANGSASCLSAASPYSITCTL